VYVAGLETQAIWHSHSRSGTKHINHSFLYINYNDNRWFILHSYFEFNKINPSAWYHKTWKWKIKTRVTVLFRVQLFLCPPPPPGTGRPFQLPTIQHTPMASTSSHQFWVPQRFPFVLFPATVIKYMSLAKTRQRTQSTRKEGRSSLMSEQETDSWGFLFVCFL